MTSTTTRWLLSLVLLAIWTIGLQGCVSRRLTVRSQPPGAFVEVDGERIGTTPASMDFDYYGTREITLTKAGYEATTVLQPIPAPFYQRFPLEFFTDNFLGFQLNNRYDFTYPLQPQTIVPDAELQGRADQLRSQALGGM